MAINNEALRKRASRLISEFPKGPGEPVPAIAIDATDVLSLLDQIERVELVSRMVCNHDGYMAVINERDQLRAENESLSGSLERAYANYNQASFASTERGKERDQLKAEVEALRDSRRPHDAKSDTVWCACGDGYPADSYGAGFMDANNGVCENCQAAADTPRHESGEQQNVARHDEG